MEKPVRYSGFEPGAASYLIARTAAYAPLSGPGDTGSLPTAMLVVVPDTQAGETLLSDISFFLAPGGKSPLFSGERGGRAMRACGFFGWEVLPFDLLSPTDVVSAGRLHTLSQLVSGEPVIVVATVDSLMQRIIGPDELRRSVFELRAAQSLERDALVSLLIRGGYTRSSLVEECGQLAVRGAIVDFFPPGSSYPVRVELFDDAVDSIRLFDPATQRSLRMVQEFTVLPVKETFWLHEHLRREHGRPAKDGRGQEGEITRAIQRLRARASELSIPQASIRPVEEALEDFFVGDSLGLPALRRCRGGVG